MTWRPAKLLDRRRHNRRFGRCAAIPVLLAASGCADPLEPGDVAGLYILDAVAGEPLPAVLREPGRHRFHAHTGELRLNADGTGRRVTTGVWENLDEEGSDPAVLASRVVFRVVDRRIEVEYICPLNAACIPPPHLVALRTAEGLRVVESALGERVPLSYVRATVME